MSPQLSPVHTVTCFLPGFTRQEKPDRVYEDTWQVFTRQVCLLESWRASFWTAGEKLPVCTARSGKPAGFCALVVCAHCLHNFVLPTGSFSVYVYISRHSQKRSLPQPPASVMNAWRWHTRQREKPVGRTHIQLASTAWETCQGKRDRVYGALWVLTLNVNSRWHHSLLFNSICKKRSRNISFFSDPCHGWAWTDSSIMIKCGTFAKWTWASSR